MIRHALDLILGSVVILAIAAMFSAPPVRASECRPMKVSWYGNEHHGRKTASGARFNQWGLTAAMVGRQHIGERWKITLGKRSVVVTVNDTGGFAKYGRGMDLSRGAFARLANTDTGVIRVTACKL